MPRTKKPKYEGEYRNLIKAAGTWSFEVKTKDGWIALGGLSGEVNQVDAEAFAKNTAYGWRKK